MRKIIVLLSIVIVLLLIIILNKKDKVIIIDGNTSEVSEVKTETTTKNIILPGFEYLDINKPGKLLINYNEDYYLKFSIYLKENDELIYSSDLVPYNNYISTITLNKELDEGVYEAYVLIEPYDYNGNAYNKGRIKIRLKIWKRL